MGTQTSPSGAVDQAAWQRVSVVVVFKGGLRKNSTYRHVPETFSPCLARSARSSVRSRGVELPGGLAHSEFGFCSSQRLTVMSQDPFFSDLARLPGDQCSDQKPGHSKSGR